MHHHPDHSDPPESRKSASAPMGTTRRWIAVSGFLGLAAFGFHLRGWYTDYKWILESALFLTATLYFVWLATWTRWNDPQR